MQKVYLTKEFEFEAAHQLRDYQGSCKNLHGHSYVVEVQLSGYVDVPSDDLSKNMLMDFKSIKSLLLEHCLKRYDHSFLNESMCKEGSSECYYAHPTAEFMAVDFFSTIKQQMESLYPQITLESVKVWETKDSCAEYKGESR